MYVALGHFINEGNEHIMDLSYLETEQVTMNSDVMFSLAAWLELFYMVISYKNTSTSQLNNHSSHVFNILKLDLTFPFAIL